MVMLGHGFWQRAFGGDAGAVGKTMTLNAQPYTIVGAMPASFRWGGTIDILAPLAPDSGAQPWGSPAVGDRPAGRRRIAAASHQRARGHGGALLIRSFARLQQVNPGFNTSGVMTARIGLPNTTYPGGPPKRAFFERLLADLRGRPGIEAAAIASGPPLSGDFTAGDVKLPTQSNEEAGSAAWRLAGPGYFAAMGIPVRGREFTSQDVCDVRRFATEDFRGLAF